MTRKAAATKTNPNHREEDDSGRDRRTSKNI